METEQERIGKLQRQLCGIKIKRNGVELERKWDGKLTKKLERNKKEMEWKSNADGMEKK